MITIPGYSSISDHPFFSRFIKGVFNIRPSVPRYTFIWDTDVLLKFLKLLTPNNMLPFKELCLKLACLLTLLAGQRVHSVHKISVTHMDINLDAMLCHIPELLKTTRPKILDRTLSYRAFPGDLDLCPVDTMNILSQRAVLVSSDITQLFITYGRPHHPATKDTIARWVKCAMSLAGIDTRCLQQEVAVQLLAVKLHRWVYLWIPFLSMVPGVKVQPFTVSVVEV